MKIHHSILIIALFFLSTLKSYSQVDNSDAKKEAYLNEQTDSILGPAIELQEVIIDRSKIKADEETKKRFLILQRRVYKVYPYAKAGAERLTMLNKGMRNLTNNRDKKKYFKIVEHYLTNEFELQLKNLSRKDGQILIKLIHRQTGKTTYELIRDLKSGWKAFWSNNTASLFDLNLKTEYSPMAENEDYMIETILVRAFQNNRLLKQDPAIPINYDDVADYWREKLKEAKAK